MILTRKQEEGLRIAIDRYKNKEKYTVISGYAGTGKSTLIRFIIDALNVDEDKVCYCAYTGKATEVLRKKEIKMFVLYIDCFMSIFLNQMEDFLEKSNHI